MKICILSSFEDSMLRDTGYSVRIYNLAKNLARFGNKVSIIIPGRNITAKKVHNLTVYEIKGFLPVWFLKVIGNLLGITKITSIYFYDPIFILRVGKILRHADIVQVEQQSTGVLLALITKLIWKKPVIADCHDVLQALRINCANKLRRILEFFLEIVVYKFVSLILVVSEKEKRLLISCGIKKPRIEVIPNGVDTEEFNMNNYVQSVSHVKEHYGLKGYHVVTFVGNMEYSPNREAVELISLKIAPSVRKTIENVKFLVIGRTSEKMNSADLIFTGRVENVAELLSTSDIAIAPLLHGSGTRLKILEYFSCSLPVVSTPIGVEGLDVKNGVHVLIANSVEEFSDNIIRLLKNKELALKMGKAARQFVIMKYDWRVIGEKLNEVYKKLIQPDRRYSLS